MTVDISDILGMPHRIGAQDARSGALDCTGATILVVGRILGPRAARALLGLVEGHGLDPAGIQPSEGGSRLPAWATPQPGDVIVSDPGSGYLHLSAVSEIRPVPMAVSSSAKLGVFKARVSTMTCIEGMYRYGE